MFAWLSTYVTVIRNIPLMRRQNTDIAWNRMMLRADITLLHTDIMLLSIHTCTQWRYIMVLTYMSVLTLKGPETPPQERFDDLNQSLHVPLLVFDSTSAKYGRHTNSQLRFAWRF